MMLLQSKEDKFLILKLNFLSLILTNYLFAITVLISKDALKYEEKIDTSNVIVKEVETIGKTCNPLTLQQLESSQFITTHYINKNTIICEKDVKGLENEGIVFNFGGLKIEKKGKIIFENNEFIRIKNLDGTIEQIYKDGRLK